MDYRVIIKAGITQSEFGKLMGVSRVTANRWMRGHEPYRLVHDQIVDMLARIEEAVEDNKLPLPIKHDHAERYQAIREALNLPPSQ